jgi:hypothetical protein
LKILNRQSSARRIVDPACGKCRNTLPGNEGRRPGF